MIRRRLDAALFLLLVAAKLSLAQQDTMTVCPVNSQDFILRDRAILPLSNIIATSEDSRNNPVTGFVDTTSAPWCTAENQGAAEIGNHVELVFTESIVVEFLESQPLVNSLVSNFSIQYSESETGDDFVTYGVLETSQSFIIEDVLSSPGSFSLERPIVARRLRLVINNGETDFAGRLCWQIEMFGCLLSRARQIQSGPPSGTDSNTATTTDSPLPSSQSLPLTTPADCPGSTSSTGSTLSARERQQEILIIVLPAALATVVVVLIISFISVLVCVCASRRSSSKETPSRAISPNNPCFNYDSPRPVAYDVPRASIRSRGGSFQSSTDALQSGINNEFKNPMYITKQGIQRANSNQFSSLSNNPGVRESSATNDYEMISDGVTMDNRFYEMQRTNSQPNRPTPELPAARNAHQTYASIPANGAPPPMTITVPFIENKHNNTTSESSSTKVHSYAKARKPSNTQGRVGGVDPAPPSTTSVPLTDIITTL